MVARLRDRVRGAVQYGEQDRGCGMRVDLAERALVFPRRSTLPMAATVSRRPSSLTQAAENGAGALLASSGHASVASLARYTRRPHPSALTAAMNLLTKQVSAEADNFRSTVIVAIEAAVRTHQGESSPTMAEMARTITGALDAA